MLNKIFKSKILITGGAGFIGSFVVEELLKYEPARIVIIDNLVRGSLDNMKSFANHARVEFVEGDIRDEQLLDKLLFGTDYVFHMAALRINACAANPAEGFDVMVKATFNLAQLCIRHQVKKIIYSSSASVYGLAQQFPTPETDHPYGNQTFYGAAKLWGEQLFRSYHFVNGLNYVALRYFNVYGPRMDTDGKYTEVLIRWLDCINDNEAPLIYGTGDTTMDFVFVKDVAKANVAALISNSTDEVFNIGTGVETSLSQLLAAVLEVHHSGLVPHYMPENIVNPVSRRLASIDKAERLLNFKPSMNLENGLRELSQWYFSRKKLSMSNI